MSPTVYLGDVQVDAAKLADLCQRFGVRELALFGSAVRGEMRPDSDIDVMVEFDPAARVGIFKFESLVEGLEALVGRKINMVTKRGLKPWVRQGFSGPGIVCGIRLPTDSTSSPPARKVEPLNRLSPDLRGRHPEGPGSKWSPSTTGLRTPTSIGTGKFSGTLPWKTSHSYAKRSPGYSKWSLPESGTTKSHR